VEKGKNNGIIFSLGVSTMIMMQAYVAVLISKLLFNNPEIVDLLMKIALGIFAFLAVYFFVKAKKIKPNKIRIVKMSKKNSFFKGMLLAALNLLTIPYYSGLNVMWNASGWIKFQVWDIATFILAAGSGTFTVLYLYTFYFNKLELKTKNFSKNSNYVISVLMVILLIITVIRLFYRDHG
jgi:cytochrome c biogenesis protein CcdA